MLFLGFIKNFSRSFIILIQAYLHVLANKNFCADKNFLKVYFLSKKAKYDILNRLIFCNKIKMIDNITI